MANNGSSDAEWAWVFADLIDMFERKLLRHDEAGTRAAALMGDRTAQAKVIKWDAEDGMEFVSEYTPDGEDIETLAELAAIMGTTPRVAAMYVLEQPGRYDKIKKEANALLASVAGEENNNVFVALLPEDPEQFTVKGGVPASDIHMTLAFSLPVSGVNPEDVMVELSGARVTQFEAEIAGVTTFNNSGAPRSPLVALVSSANLDDIRPRVLTRLRASGVELDRKHGYLPHITLGYVKPGSNLSIRSLPKTVKFTRMLVTAPGFRAEVPLPETMVADSEGLETKPTSLVEG